MTRWLFIVIPRVNNPQLPADHPTARNCQFSFSPWFIFNLKVTTISFSISKWIVGSYWSVLEWATSSCKQTSKSFTFIFFCHFSIFSIESVVLGLSCNCHYNFSLAFPWQWQVRFVLANCWMLSKSILGQLMSSYVQSELCNQVKLIRPRVNTGC